MTATAPRWTVAIFTSRETITALADCLRATVLACHGRQVVIDVLVNGNRALADAAVVTAASATVLAGLGPHSMLRVWFLPLGDKAATWNGYVHTIWPGHGPTFFIDGYVQVRADALVLLAQALAAAPAALAASGVPTSGRSAATLRAGMLRHGGIHGNLHALPTAAMRAIRRAHFHLPLGLYRTDALIGAALMYRLDPAVQAWDSARIVVDPRASWLVPAPSPWSLPALLGQLSRRRRQAQGELENRAARAHFSIRRLAPALLENTVGGFVGAWIAAEPGAARGLFLRQPLTWFAARRLRRQRDWNAAALPPQLRFQHGEVAATDVPLV